MEATVREAVASASRNPQETFLWVRDVETVTDVSLLSESVGCSTIESKLAAALAKVVTGTLGRTIDVDKEKHARGRLMKGREILFMVYKHVKVSEAEGHTLDLQDLFTVNMHGDDLNGFR